MNYFPQSQRRPMLITAGICLPNIQSITLPRWNFRKANWLQYAADIESGSQQIPPTQQNMDRFNKLILISVKKNIRENFVKNTFLDVLQRARNF